MGAGRSNRCGGIQAAESLASRPDERRRLFRLDRSNCNPETFAELDRIIFWLEQSGGNDEMGKIIPVWTALEFFCSMPGEKDLDSVLRQVPPYLIPLIPRWQLIDLWKYMQQAGVEFDAGLAARLEIVREAGRVWASCNLIALFELCLEPEATNPMLSLLKDYPFLIAKVYGIRKLNPLKRAAATHLREFEQKLLFDIKSCYRVRNTIVHDAAMDVAQLDRVTQRLNLILCTCLDTVLGQFIRNPSLSLADLHRCNRATYENWMQQLADTNNPITFERMADPKAYFL